MAKPIPILRPGKWTAMSGQQVEFTDAMLDEIVASYDPALHKAPLVIGHPKTDDPAYGWVRSLARATDGVGAAPEKLAPSFAEAVRDGRYEKVSASLYPPDSPSNPKPGKWYLKHVGFLGAAAPAVKGLRPVELAEEGAETFEFAADKDADVAVELSDLDVAQALRGLREHLIEKEGVETADRFLSGWLLDKILADATAEAITGEPGASVAYAEPPTAKDPAALELERRETELAQREAAFAERERAQARAQRDEKRASFIERLVRDGRPLPCPRERVLEFMALLDGEQPDALAFGDGDGSAGDRFREEFLARLPKRVNLGEIGGGEESFAEQDPRLLAERASAYQAEMAAKGVYVRTEEAVRHVRQGGAG